MLFSKPGLTVTKALAAAAVCVSSSVGAVGAAQATVRPGASLPATAVSSAAIAAATANPCVAGTQGCVLPIAEAPPPVVPTTTPPPATYVEPVGTGFNLLPWIAAAALLGGFFLLDPFDLFGEDCTESPEGNGTVCLEDFDDDEEDEEDD